ncbi:MAG: hypothetical protein K0R78_777 [Pelosinus sp.]|jgi:hypothetical protein|nr:hypothetical protein [Pelosinus sp.]
MLECFFEDKIYKFVEKMIRHEGHEDVQRTRRDICSYSS